MYSKIVNSKTGQKVSVTSRLGKNILEKYLNVLTGGSASKESTLSEKNVTLNSQEGKDHVVTEEVAFMSGLVRSLLRGAEDEDEDEDLDEGAAAGSRTPESRTIPVPNVKSTTLDKVIEFCKHHCDVKDTKDELLPAEFEASDSIAAPLKSASLRECGIPQWYVTFVAIAEGTEPQKEEFYDLILAADYLGIPPLLNLTCAKMASMMKGKTVHEIRDTFEIGECTEESMADVVDAKATWLVGLKTGRTTKVANKMAIDELKLHTATRRKEYEEARAMAAEDLAGFTWS